MGGWGCPHEVNGKCSRVNDEPCDPGMKGCILFGRFKFSDSSKNRSEESRKRRNEALKKDPGKKR